MKALIPMVFPIGQGRRSGRPGMVSVLRSPSPDLAVDLVSKEVVAWTPYFLFATSLPESPRYALVASSTFGQHPSFNLERYVIHPVTTFNLKHNRVARMETGKFLPKFRQACDWLGIDGVDHVSGPYARSDNAAISGIRIHNYP